VNFQGEAKRGAYHHELNLSNRTGAEKTEKGSVVVHQQNVFADGFQLMPKSK